MKKNLLIILLFLPILGLKAQNDFKRNAAYLELGGAGLLISANVERQLQNKPGFGLRVGGGYYRSDEKEYFCLPLGIVYLIKTNKKTVFWEVSFGATYTKADVKLYTIVDYRDPLYVSQNEWNFVPAIGYRKQSKKNWLFRFNLSPVINQHGLLPYIGFSWGKVF